MTQIDLTQMTITELEQHVDRLYGVYLYHEAAERGYDIFAAHAAYGSYLEAKKVLDSRSQQDDSILGTATRIRDLSRELEQFVAGETAA